MFEGQGRNVLENLRVEEAIEQLLMYTKAVQEAETVSLLSANGRILAEDMKAERDNPPFDRAPVDGYACKAEDLAGALPEKQMVMQSRLILYRVLLNHLRQLCRHRILMSIHSLDLT